MVEGRIRMVEGRINSVVEGRINSWSKVELIINSMVEGRGRIGINSRWSLSKVELILIRPLVVPGQYRPARARAQNIEKHKVFEASLSKNNENVRF